MKEKTKKAFLAAYDEHADAIYRHIYFRLLSKDMEALKTGHPITAVLDGIVAQVQANLANAAESPASDRAKFAQAISVLVADNTTMINWRGLGCWWGPR